MPIPAEAPNVQIRVRPNIEGGLISNFHLKTEGLIARELKRDRGLYRERRLIKRGA